MNALEFIKRVKNEGESLPVWWVNRKNFDVDETENWTKAVSGVCQDRSMAVATLKELAAAHKAEFGQRDEFVLMRGEVEPDDLNDVDWEELEEYPEDFTEADVLEMVIQNGSMDFDDVSEYVDYDYPSVEGALLVVWRWERHIGYARNFVEMRWGVAGETEELCVEQDKVFAPQVSVLCTKDELDGLSDADRRQLILQRLDEPKWRWTPKSYGLIQFDMQDF